LFFDKTIIALSGGHFEYFFTFSENIYTCLGTSFSMMRSLKLKGAFAFDKHFEQFEGIGRLP
jgi:hypothetical protein